MQNPLFWSHYAGIYTGICVQLSATGDLGHSFCNVMKVHYSEDRPTVFSSQTGALGTVYDKHQDWDYISQYGVCTKSRDWAVEREWRWWVPWGAGRYHKLTPSSLKAVFIGPLADSAITNKVLALAKGREVKVFETRLSAREFKVEIGKRLDAGRRR
jgi:hypothetical protein